MNKKEKLEAIEKFGHYIIEYAKKEKEDIEETNQDDLKKLMAKCVMPALILKFSSPYLEAIKADDELKKQLL